MNYLKEENANGINNWTDYVKQMGEEAGRRAAGWQSPLEPHNLFDNSLSSKASWSANASVLNGGNVFTEPLQSEGMNSGGFLHSEGKSSDNIYGDGSLSSDEFKRLDPLEQTYRRSKRTFLETSRALEAGRKRDGEFLLKNLSKPQGINQVQVASSKLPDPVATSRMAVRESNNLINGWNGQQNFDLQGLENRNRALGNLEMRKANTWDGHVEKPEWKDSGSDGIPFGVKWDYALDNINDKTLKGLATLGYIARSGYRKGQKLVGITPKEDSVDDYSFFVRKPTDDITLQDYAEARERGENPSEWYSKPSDFLYDWEVDSVPEAVLKGLCMAYVDQNCTPTEIVAGNLPLGKVSMAKKIGIKIPNLTSQEVENLDDAIDSVINLKNQIKKNQEEAKR